MAEVVRFADIKQRVLETQAELSVASAEARAVNARLLSLLEAIERTLLHNQAKIQRMRRLGRAVVAFGLVGWFAVGTLVLERQYGRQAAQLSDGPAPAARSGTAAADPASRDLAAVGPAAERSSTGTDARSHETAGVAATTLSPAGPPPLSEAVADGPPDVDALLAAPDDYRGRDIVVTGALVRLFNRYRLKSEVGANTIVIDIDGIRPSERTKLEAAIATASLLVPVRARITGKVEGRSSADYRLVASDLQLLEPRDRPAGREPGGRG